MKKKKRYRWSVALCGIILATGASLVFLRGWSDGASRASPARPSQATEPACGTGSCGNLAGLLRLPADRLARTDAGLMNLLCAEGLPGAEGLSAAYCLKTLDHWGARVRSETDRHLYRFRQNPREFDNLEGFFRMLMMAVVLAEDFKVAYNPARMAAPGQASARDGFFADSRDVFLHGLVGPRRMGTCSSMPVLYVALGRRLGYPVALVTTKGHLFVRWEDSR
jgi:hypothetical protein